MDEGTTIKGAVNGDRLKKTGATATVTLQWKELDAKEIAMRIELAMDAQHRRSCGGDFAAKELRRRGRGSYNENGKGSSRRERENNEERTAGRDWRYNGN